MAANKVDMSLDDIIKTSKIGKGGRRGGRGNIRGGRARARGFNGNYSRRGFGRMARRGVAQRRNQPQRYIPRGNIDGVWTHDLFVGRPLRANTEGKLLISNLDYGVSESDIKELFSEFGELIKSAVHFDFSGRSLGTAEVIYSSRQDAIKAMNRYNSVPLDGRPMNIQIVENSLRRSLPQRTRSTGQFGSRRGGFASGNTNYRGTFRRGSFRGSVRGRSSFRGRRGVSRGARQSAVTKEELDAQLDSYNKMDIE